ncbi:MAG: hotdog fold thioesterase [Pseudomonadota bacterium]
MDDTIRDAILAQVATEPFAEKMNLTVTALEAGRAVVEMPCTTAVDNLFGMTHGGAIFSLMDEAFQIACNSHGTVAVALNVSVTYYSPPDKGTTLRAEATEEHRSRRTGSYRITVTDDAGRAIASCQALAYRTGKPLPFLPETDPS